MIPIFVVFVTLLLFPETTHDGIKNGLILLENQVIPSLYPFILLSTYMRRYCKAASSSVLLLIGLLSGYPIGAKIVSENNFNKLPLSKQQLLLICNLPSPSYLLSYVTFQCLKQTHLFIPIYISIIIGNVATLLLNHFFLNYRKTNLRKANTVSICSVDHTSSPTHLDLTSIAQETVHSLIDISTYILIFSLISAFIKKIRWIPSPWNSILIGIFEMTNGINQLMTTSLSTQSKLIILTGILTFGGLSVIAQTHAMVQNSSDISTKKYMTDKAIASCIAMSVMYGFTLFL